MGRVCDICGRKQPNEAFGGGRGQRSRVCNRCMRMPKQKRKLLLAKRELSSFLDQTHISDRNIVRIRQLAESADQQIAALGTGMLTAVSSAPTHKRKKGRISVAVTREMCSDIYAHWRATDELSENDKNSHIIK